MTMMNPDESARATDLFADGALTRTAVRARHALLTPDGLRVVSRLPGWDAAAQVVVAISAGDGGRARSANSTSPCPPGPRGKPPRGKQGR